MNPVFAGVTACPWGLKCRIGIENARFGRCLLVNDKVVDPVDHIKNPPAVSFEKQGLKFAFGVTLVKLS